MNYNPNNAPRPGGLGRKAKRVSDVAALGMPSHSPTSSAPPPGSGPAPGHYQPPGYNPQTTHFQSNPSPTFDDNAFDTHNYGMNMSNPNNSYGNQFPMNNAPHTQMPNMASFMQNSSQIGVMLQQPMVQGMAMEFGQQLANQGKDIVNKKIEKYVSVSELKYYFAVDTKYVIKKLCLIFFPFTHKNWSVKYDQEHPVQPRYDINAPDLYIPTMAYVTYVMLAGFVLGIHSSFSPEKIGIQASSALAYNIFELCIYAMTKYISNIQTRLGIYDLLAFSGYKYPIIIASIFTSLLFKNVGYYVCLVYCSFALSVFLMRTLKIQILTDPSTHHDYAPDVYTQNAYSSGSKRRKYFMFFIIVMQPILAWWLSYHLALSKAVEIPT